MLLGANMQMLMDSKSQGSYGIITINATQAAEGQTVTIGSNVYRGSSFDWYSVIVPAGQTVNIDGYGYEGDCRLMKNGV